jgi:LPS sulfotransferase NodH
VTTKIVGVRGLRRSLQPVLLPIRLLLSESTAGLRTRLSEAGVTRTFFVCSTPRTGSTMLDEMLADTRLVGRAGEFFGSVFLQDVAPRLGVTGFDDYLLSCTRHRRGTAFFGIKLQWHQVAVFLSLLRRRRGARDLSDGALLETIFPEPSFIWLRRGDEVAQAVSWWRAMTTGKWTERENEAGPAVFDYEGIAVRLRRIRDQNEAWRRWFEVNRIEPFLVTYEDVVADTTSAVSQVLAFVGVEVPEVITVTPGTQRQGGQLNEEWAHRFRQLAEPVTSPSRGH